MTPFDELRRKYRAEADRYIAKFGLTGRHNGQADAFRHAYASAAMTQDYGEWVANIAGQSHEIKNQIGAWWENEDKSREVKMDLHNNQRGRLLADGAIDRDENAERTLKDLKYGNLVTTLDQQTSYDGEISAESTGNLKQRGQSSSQYTKNAYHMQDYFSMRRSGFQYQRPKNTPQEPELRKIEKMMRNDRDAYFKDEAVQKRYRDLLNSVSERSDRR